MSIKNVKWLCYKSHKKNTKTQKYLTTKTKKVSTFNLLRCFIIQIRCVQKTMYYNEIQMCIL